MKFTRKDDSCGWCWNWQCANLQHMQSLSNDNMWETQKQIDAKTSTSYTFVFSVCITLWTLVSPDSYQVINILLHANVAIYVVSILVLRYTIDHMIKIIWILNEKLKTGIIGKVEYELVSFLTKVMLALTLDYICFLFICIFFFNV